MNMNKNSRMTSAALVVLGVSLLAASANAGMPPSRQTPIIVPSDKRGVVEVGPCQLPPCVGGVTCTPNARDYGYYEATWRQWPTQQRYDQKFPEALNSSPINRKKSAVSASEAVPVPEPVNPNGDGITGLQSIQAPSTNVLTPQTEPAIDVDSITIQDDAEPVPAMGNFEGPSPVPSTSIVPQPTQKVDPLMDYSGNSAPGISTTPVAVPATIPAPEVTPAPALEAAPADVPAPPLSDAPDSAKDVTSFPSSDDTELTPPAPKEDSPLIEPGDGGNADDSLTLPVSRGKQSEAHSIIVSQRERAINPYDQATDPYHAAIQVSHEERIPLEERVSPEARISHEVKIPQVTEISHEERIAQEESTAQEESAAQEESTAQEAKVAQEEKPIETLNPFQTAVEPEQVVYGPVVQNVQESIPEMNAEMVGLEGFCPVTLLESEEWVEGKEEWTVMNHGITYHLASAGQVQKFLSDPDAYTPVMDGADPVLFAETGVKTPGNADNCVVFEGKLFMFANEENLNKFFANSASYIQAIQKK